jgi:ABC-type amino acid transport substrate-binding protein
LSGDSLDIIIGGFIVTTRRIEYIKVSHPYFYSRDVLLVRTKHAGKISSLDDLKSHNELTVGAYRNPVLISLLKEICPDNPIVYIDSYKDIVTHPGIDFVIWSFEKAVAFAYSNPGFTVVVNEDIGSRLLFAYYMSDENEALKEYINYWIDIQKTNGFIEKQKKYWFKGKTYESFSR